MAPILQFMANLISQLILVRAYCKLLEMRSNIVFGVLNITGMLVAIAVDALLTAPLFRTLIMGPVVFFVLPIACSRGPLRQRVLRCALMLTTMVSSVLPLALITLAGLGPSAANTPGYADNMSAIATLVVSVVSTAFFTEVLLTVVARWEKRQDITLAPPFVFLLLWSYLISVFSFTLTSDSAYAGDAKLGVVGFIYYVLVFALCAASVALFRGEVRTAWHESQRTLTDEQSKLVRAEIDAATERAAIARRLHHVLANKAATICELVERGNTHGAEAYLSALRDQASRAVSPSDDELDGLEDA